MNKNRDKGLRYERKIREELEEMGYDVKTARNESHTLDALGVDLVGNIPFHPQCKSTQKLPNPWKLFMKMPEDKMKVIFWHKKYLEDLVILNKDDFYKLLNSYEVFRAKRGT